MNKHFVFKDDSWWDQAPCDCCDDCYIEAYNCTSHEQISWTCTSYHEVYQAAVLLAQGYDLDDYDSIEKSLYYDMSPYQLEAECVKLGITVEIIE